MRKKLTILIPLLAIFIFIAIAGTITIAGSNTGSSTPVQKTDPNALLEQAKKLMKDKKYADAEKIYLQIKAENPGSDKALESQKQIVFIDIAQKNQEKADTDFQQLITEYAGNKNLADAVYRIGVEYRLTAKNMDKSLELHKLNVENHPDSIYGLWSQVEIARTYVRQGNELADEETDKMVNLFANQPTLPKEIYTMAIAYTENKKEEQALKLYQYDMQKYPDNLYSALSKVKYHYLKKDYDSADAAVSSLIAAFPNEEEAKKCLRDTASFYRSQKEYKRAIPLYQYQIEHKSIFGEPVDAFRNLAFTYIDMNDTEAGTSVINTMQADLSESKQLARATYDIARYYKDKGDIENALRIHEFNVDKNTKSTESMWSQTEITYHYIRSGDISNAETAYQKLLTTFKDQKTLPKEVFQVGDAYRKVKQYDKALSLYKYQLEKWPDYGEPVDIYRKMACTYIDMKDIENADAVIAQMQEKFAKNTRLARMNFDIGNYFLNDANDPANALKVHQYNADHYTNIMEAMWSQAAIVRYHVRAKDDSKADESYAKLLNTFKDQKTLAKEVFQIADIYTEVGNTAKAIELAEYTIEKWPDSEYKLDAQKSIVKAQFGNDDYVAVGVSLDKLIADSKDNSELARILFDFGDEYYEKAFNKEIEERPQKTVIYIDELKPPNSKVINYYSCAQTVWQKLIDRFPDSDFTGEAMFMTGEMNRAIKQYERAIEYYSNFIDKWPKHEIAWIAQDRVISLFREMKFTGKISEFEGDILLVAAQEKLLQQFPDCPIVENIKKDMSVNKKRAAFHESLKNKKVRNIRGKQEQEGGSR